MKLLLEVYDKDLIDKPLHIVYSLKEGNLLSYGITQKATKILTAKDENGFKFQFYGEDE